jgi:aspartate dehydrogenase
MRTKKIGIVGCGAIGSALAEYAAKNLDKFVSGIVLWDIDTRKAEALAKEIPSVTIAGGMEETLEKTGLIIEAACPQVVPDILKTALEKGKDVMIMSVGGFVGNEGLLAKAREKGIRLILPSGAVAGIDALKSAKLAGIESVTLTTRKPPRAIKGAPYLLEKGIDAETITGETVIFEGNALDAIKGFPKNINVSALLSLAGIGARDTKVRIIVSPEYKRNTHEIEVRSKAGIFTTRAENVPSPDNPGTSYLAVLAAIVSLKEYFDTVRIGT